ncbi:MAG: ribonuclease R [Ruminococcaceae bacterium]|nr:ribonuclease R [Oscillospiraceae bacterium]
MHKEKISAFVNSKEYVPMSRENIAVLLCVPQNDMSEFNKIIDELIDEGIIIVGRKKRCFSAKSMGLIQGEFRSTTKGFGFVTDDSGDIHISSENVNGALNGDTVLVKLKKSAMHERNREGVILRVLTRSNRTVVGIYTQERGYGILTPDNQKLPDEIFVMQRDSLGALNGQKVVCQITEYDSPTTSLSCKVVEVLGFPYDFGVDVLSVIKSYDFSTEFPKDVIAESEQVAKINHEDLEERLDLTDSTIITIDGEDTKDIDDAVSVEKTASGYRLGVHIADVSNYVKPGSKLDIEAYARGTSVYLADRVIPMLPVKLSNDICSLNEGVLRLTMSAIMDFDNDGNLTNASFHKSYIKSANRMTYNNIRLLIEEKPADLCEKYNHLFPMLDAMYELYMLLAEKTKERGSIDFNIPEAKAVFDKNGKTTDIVLRESSFANKIIEEFMVAANSAVAKFLWEKNIPSIYRVHDIPNQERLENTLNFIYNMGYGQSRDIHKIIELVKGTPQEAAFSTMLLRSMAKAKYSSQNDGHYGLGLENYCHFTSPIRRYPDLVCHRALKAAIENDKKTKAMLKPFVEEAAIQSSERENAAAMCERDTLDIKKAEYMEKFVGQEFEGVISSVTGFGFFVMLPNTVEGLVRLETLRDDYYVFEEKTLSLYGERSGHTFTIGDVVKVKLAAASKVSRRIDFILLEGGSNSGRKRTEKASRSKQKRSSRVLHRRKVRGRH